MAVRNGSLQYGKVEAEQLPCWKSAMIWCDCFGGKPASETEGRGKERGGDFPAQSYEWLTVLVVNGLFLTVAAIADESTKGIAELVAKQKSSRARKSWAARAHVASPSLNPQLGRACMLPTTAVAGENTETAPI